MAWTRSDDNTLLHPKVLRAGRGGDDRMVNEVYGFVARCCTWSGGLLTDGFIPLEIAEVASPTRWEVLTKAAVKADMLRRHRGPDGDWGWTVVMEDQLFHVRSKAEVMKDREASRRLTRVQAIARDVRLRDGDQCRYCAKTVTFEGDRRSNRAGTYDHQVPPDQGGEETVENVVVACGGCNRAKADRTPEQAGMTLRPAPDEPYYSAFTRSWLDLDAPDAAPARPAAEGADTAATGRARSRTARPVSDLDLPASGGSPGSGRDGPGSGLVGGPPDAPHHLPQRTDQPRTRGSRGRRGRSAPQATPEIP